MYEIASHPAAPFVVALILKATLILALAGAVSRLLHRSAAAARHLVWTLAIGALLVLPLLTFALPPLSVPVLPDSPARAMLTPLGSLVVEPAIASERMATSEPAATMLPAVQSEHAPDRSSGLPVSLPHLPTWMWLVGIWALGAALVLGRLAMGRLSLYLLARNADIVPDPDWTRLVRDLSWMIDLNRPVHLLRSNRASMPMTWGTWKPVVLLPAEADEWPAERRRVVLIHELAHVQRCDCLTQLVAGVACALYWFHPGVWYAAGRLRAERERACDDRVLEVGTRASEYAGHLLEVARRFRPVGIASAAAVAMARPSQLEGRLLAVLDPVRSRWEPGGRARILAGIAALGLVAPLAAMRPVAHTPAPSVEPAETRPAHHAQAPATEVESPEQVIERRFPAKPGQALRLDLGTGGDVQVQGWDREQVWVRAKLGGSDWQGTRVEFIEYPDGLEIGSRMVAERRATSTSHKFEVRVPRRFNVDVRSSGGGVELTELQGNFTGKTGGGGLNLSKLRGEVRLATGGGGVMISDSRLGGEIHTGGGGGMLRNTTGGIQVHSGGGAVIRSGNSHSESRSNPSDVVRIHRAEGAITVARAPAGAEVFTGGGAIVIGNSRGPVRAQTGSGAIRVRSAVDLVKLGSGSGTIMVDAIDGGAAASTRSGAVSIHMVGDARRGDRGVELRSGNGNIELILPAGIDATFDIETAFSGNGGSRPRIISDFPLSQSEGSRFVRAKGRVGSGKHRVYIRTVNGDVRLRQDDGTAKVLKKVDEHVDVKTVAKAHAIHSGAGAGGGYAYVTGASARERRRAVEMMARNAPPSAALAALTRLAWDDGDAGVRHEAVQNLAELPGDMGLAELIRISRMHPEDQIRREAVEGLSALGCDESVGALLQVVEHERNTGVQREAVKALADAYGHSTDGGLSERIITSLERIARMHPDLKVRAHATEQLEEMRHGELSRRF